MSAQAKVLGLVLVGLALLVGLVQLDRQEDVAEVVAPDGAREAGFQRREPGDADLVAPARMGQEDQRTTVFKQAAPSAFPKPVSAAPEEAAGPEAAPAAQGPTRARLNGTITVADPRLANTSFYVNLFGPVAEGEQEKRPIKRVSGKGSYEMKGVQPGPYHLVLSATSGGVRLADRDIVLAPGDNMQDLFVQSLPVEECLIVRAEVPGGEPAGPRGLAWQRIGEGGKVRWQYAAQTSLDDGGQLIPVPKEWKEGSAPGAALPMLSATHKEFSDVLVSVAAGTREVMLQFGEPARLELSLANLPPELAEHVQIMVQRVGGPPGSGETRSRFPESAGGYVMEQVEHGSNRVHVFNRRNGTNDRRFLCKATIEVAPGTNTAVIDVPTLHDVSVSIPGGEPGRKIRIRRDSDQAKRPKYPDSYKEPRYVVGSAVLGEHGRALIQDVPIGKYKISCGRLNGEITVPCGEFVLR